MSSVHSEDYLNCTNFHANKVVSRLPETTVSYSILKYNSITRSPGYGRGFLLSRLAVSLKGVVQVAFWKVRSHFVKRSVHIFDNTYISSLDLIFTIVLLSYIC